MPETNRFLLLIRAAYCVPSYLAGMCDGQLELSGISLVHFKNYQSAHFDFRKRIIAICGANGIGKTNLLDAVYYLCFTRSYFSKSDQANVRKEAQGFRLEGRLELNGQSHLLVCILRETGKKELSLDGEAYEKFSAHIGRFPCVMIAPDDVQIISGGSEERRRYVDALLSQLNPEYLRSLIEYNKLIQQRNTHLKYLADSRSSDLSLLDVYDGQLQRPTAFIFEQRTTILRRLLPVVQTFYTEIAGKAEDILLDYESALQTTAFAELLLQNRQKDLMLQRTNTGIHKDEINIKLSGQSFRQMASQGQRKSLLFALKLAEYELIKDAKSFAPLLLLDDVFEKLDEGRMHNLLSRVCKQDRGQIFITDTHKERIRKQMQDLDSDYQLIQL